MLPHSEGLPVVLKRMTLAIYGKIGGAKDKKFLSAFEIAKSSLIKSKYLAASLQLTSTGRKLEQVHARKSDTVKKVREFDALWARYAHAIGQKSDDKGTD